MKNKIKTALLKIVFGIFAVCMVIAAIAFNLAILKLSVIFFVITLVLAVIMIGISRIKADKGDADIK